MLLQCEISVKIKYFRDIYFLAYEKNVIISKRTVKRLQKHKKEKDYCF